MNSALKKSIALHIVVFLLFIIDLPLFWSNKMTVSQVPIIVDLKDVKISEMTNLPPKAKFGKEDKAASQKQRKIEENYTKDEPKEEPVEKPEPKKAKEPEPAAVQEEKPKEIKKDFLVAPQPKKPKAPVVKPEPKKEPKPKPKPEPKKPEPKKVEKKEEPKLANPLKSLLASVDQMKKEIGENETEATVKEGTQVQNMGVEGGTGGSYFNELSVSEMDALAGRLRACWNLDPGAMGIDNMIIEIRASLNQDGTVRRVDVLDTSRYNSDTFFRSVADSAKRAVFICQPYNILSEKYADKYDKWSTMLLKFNPLNKQIQ